MRSAILQQTLNGIAFGLVQIEVVRDVPPRERERVPFGHRKPVEDQDRVERDLRAKFEDWTGLLQRHTPQARQVLKKLLDGPILFTPVQVGNDSYCEFKATIGLSQMLSGTVLATMVASPQGIAELCTVEI
jgi:hypothetical protein